VFVVYNEFRSAISQVVTVKQVLPVVPEKTAAPTEAGVDFIYEPNKQVLLERMVPLYVQIQIYRAALESIAAEFAARMTAMENATKNAGEMIAKLTLIYNRARQASITKELLEIIGAEALKGKNYGYY
jgi:F-type H+-transporting ATPase subunit gamma